MPTTSKIRLNKFIADCGYTSRHAAEKLIKDGQILVNRIREANPGRMVHPTKDSIKVLTGPYLKLHKNTKTILFNKPEGYTCTKTDPQKDKSIYELLPNDCRHLSVQSRLRRQDAGLVILKNGPIPYRHIIEYEVHVPGQLSNKQVKSLKFHIKKNEVPITITSTLHRKKADETVISLSTTTIDQTQIPKLLSCIKSPKLLVRTRMGKYSLEGLKSGTCKEFNN